MAYIGNKPTVGNFQICDAISVVNGQAAYTMQVGSVNVIPQSANHMIVSLNGTIQKPNSSFTVSGAVITFSSNLVTNDVIDFIQILGDVLDLGVPSDATVTAAKLNNDIISGTTALTSEPADTDEFLVSDAGTLKRIDYSLIKGVGISMAEQWRITADASGNQNPLTANWELADTDGAGRIGSNMTQSSGVFTFPSTGIWFIDFQCSCSSAASDYINVIIQTTTNNSSYNSASEGYNMLPGSGQYTSTSVCFIFDVTNTSNDKVRFCVNPQSSSNVTMGDTGNQRTGATFIRLGDT